MSELEWFTHIYIRKLVENNVMVGTLTEKSIQRKNEKQEDCTQYTKTFAVRQKATQCDSQ